MLSKKYLVFIALLPYVMCEIKCPDEFSSLISPCMFSMDNHDKECQINCGGHDDIDLATIFEKLNAKLEPNGKHFYAINITNTAITELKENTFKDITFKYILITGADNLKLIHEKAFASNNVTLAVALSGNHQLLSTKDHSIFAMSRRFSEMVSFVLMSNGAIDGIPDGAFKGLPKLMSVSIYDVEGIKTLGADLIDDEIETGLNIILANTSISHIPAGVIRCSATRKMLFLQISSSQMTGASFDNGSLSQMNCPTSLQLMDIAYLDESVFMPFYGANERNLVNPGLLDCDDCRNYWLVQRQEVKTRTSYLNCKTGVVITDSKNFAKCK